MSITGSVLVSGEVYMTNNKTDRYSVSSVENFEPDSNNEVLKNYLGVKSKEVMDVIEQRELERAELRLWETYDENHRFTAEDIRNIHYLWLGDVYPMAGRYRNVNLSKNNFPFAAPEQIEKLMDQLEQKFLTNLSPCHFSNVSDLANALGIVHIEFILIHPFREGNGRVSRLLADLMAIQSKQPPLNYKSIDQTELHDGFERYILAIHAGHRGDYKPIQGIFLNLLEQSV